MYTSQRKREVDWFFKARTVNAQNRGELFRDIQVLRELTLEEQGEQETLELDNGEEFPKEEILMDKEELDEIINKCWQIIWKT